MENIIQLSADSIIRALSKAYPDTQVPLAQGYSIEVPEGLKIQNDLITVQLRSSNMLPNFDIRLTGFGSDGATIHCTIDHVGWIPRIALSAMGWITNLISKWRSLGLPIELSGRRVSLNAEKGLPFLEGVTITSFEVNHGLFLTFNL